MDLPFDPEALTAVPERVGDLAVIERAALWASATKDEDTADALDAAAGRLVEQSPLLTGREWWPEVVWRWPGLPRVTWGLEGGGAALVKRTMRDLVPTLGSFDSAVPAWASPLLRGRHEGGNPAMWASLRVLAAFHQNLPSR